MKKFAPAALTAALLVGATAAVFAQEKFVTIGTGGQTGVYYVVGQSICKLVNRGQERHGLKCTAPSTGGSVANINAIRAGEQDMGVAQSDQQYYGLKGEGSFRDAGAFEDERAVFSVHPEPFTVMARKDSGIKSFDDLRGKRVNIGNPGSGQRATMDVVMAVKGWDRSVFQLASELKAAEQAQALCDNKIDAMIYAVGHPNGSIQEAATSCDAVLIPVTGPEIDKLVAEHSYYSVATIPGGMYQGNPEDTKTFGVLATFVTSAKVDDDVIYEVTKAVFDNLNRFKKLHPAFANLKQENMVKDGLSAPLHDGAVKYYKEKGWM